MTETSTIKLEAIEVFTIMMVTLTSLVSDVEVRKHSKRVQELNFDLQLICSLFYREYPRLVYTTQVNSTFRAR